VVDQAPEQREAGVFDVSHERGSSQRPLKRTDVTSDEWLE
jgi:hypothetical protein